MARLGHARWDENGQTANGKPGDQTKEEVMEQSFYNREDKPWGYVFRCKDREVGELIGLYMHQACANDHIGYAQYTTGSNHFAGRYGVHYALITYKTFPAIEVDCNCDCSSLVSEVINLAGIPVSVYMNTSQEIAILDATGKFEKIKYQDGMKFVTGDVLWRNGHTAIITEGDTEIPGPEVGDEIQLKGNIVKASASGLKGKVESVKDGLYFIALSDGTRGYVEKEDMVYGDEVDLYVKDKVDYTSKFDPYFYADSYSDLKKAFGYNTINLLNHYVNFGQKEHRVAIDGLGRKTEKQYVYNKKDYTSEFNPKIYSDRYDDLKRAYGYETAGLLQHYVDFGIKEGRKAI